MINNTGQQRTTCCPITKKGQRMETTAMELVLRIVRVVAAMTKEEKHEAINMLHLLNLQGKSETFRSVLISYIESQI